jgi:hypothetical protein
MTTAREFAASVGAKFTEPSRSLLDGAKYVTADKSEISRRLKRVTEANPSGGYFEWPGPITNCNLGPEGSEQQEYEYAKDR